MFKNLHTRTKWLILCGLFIVSLGVAPYQLSMEEQLAIDFARNELIGNRCVRGLDQVYVALMIDAPSNGSTAQPSNSGNRILNALISVEADGPTAAACGRRPVSPLDPTFTSPCRYPARMAKHA
jgi:hypothetical protein